MTEKRVIPHEGSRVETGTVQFGDDWPGVFIRGDNAFAYAMALQSLLDPDTPEAGVFQKAQLRGLLRPFRDAM